MEELANLMLQLDVAEAGGERAALRWLVLCSLLRRREQERTTANAPPIDAAAAVAAVPAAEAITLDNCVLVFYDFETTGLLPKRDRLVEIGAVALRHNATTGRWVQLQGLQLLVNPGMPIPAGATQIHGITDEMVADAVDPIEGLRQLREFITRPEPTIVMAHNGMRFDRHFVRQAWLGQPDRFDPENVRFWGDSISLFKMLAPARFSSHALGSLYQELGGPGEEAHRAFGDVMMMKYVLDQLWQQRAQDFDARLDYLSQPIRNLPAHAALRNKMLFPLLD